MAGPAAARHLQRALRLACSSAGLSSPQPVPALAGLSILGQPLLPPSATQQFVHALSSAASVPSGRPAAELTDVYAFNRLISQLTVKSKPILNRTVYEDMLTDGVQPIRETFFLLMAGSMKAKRLQDVLYYFEEMKAMGITPDATAFHCVIIACGKTLQVDRAFQVAEDMMAAGIQPKHRTFLALLRSCAIAGRVDEAYGVARRMAADGLSLTKNFYVALILAHKNKQPCGKDAIPKIFELLEQSKQQSGEDLMAVAATGEFEENAHIDEELATMLEEEVQPKRYLSRNLAVYRAAVKTLNTIGNKEAVKAALKMIEDDGFEPDFYCLTELIRCYLAEGKFDEACEAYGKFVDTGKQPTIDLYIALIEGALDNYSEVSSAVARKLLVELSNRGFFLNGQIGSVLLWRACRESSRDIIIANLVWDMMKNREVKISKVVTQEYLRALEICNVAKDDPRMVEVKALVSRNRRPDLKVRQPPTSLKSDEVMEHETPSEQTVSQAPSDQTVSQAPSEQMVSQAPSGQTVSQAPSEQAVSEIQSKLDVKLHDEERVGKNSASETNDS